MSQQKLVALGVSAAKQIRGNYGRVYTSSFTYGCSQINCGNHLLMRNTLKLNLTMVSILIVLYVHVIRSQGGERVFEGIDGKGQQRRDEGGVCVGKDGNDSFRTVVGRSGHDQEGSGGVWKVPRRL